MGAIKPKHHHSDRDRIYTPEGLARILIGKIPAEPEDSWCDPCYGTGVFYNNFPTNEDKKTLYEIDLGADFLKCTKRYGWCVTNIPFSQPKDFIFKMAECSIFGFGILCLANSMTATRLQKLQEMSLFLHSMTTVYVKEWGFGYRTDFYVFTTFQTEQFEIIII